MYQSINSRPSSEQYQIFKKFTLIRIDSFYLRIKSVSTSRAKHKIQIYDNLKFALVNELVDYNFRRNEWREMRMAWNEDYFQKYRTMRDLIVFMLPKWSIFCGFWRFWYHFEALFSSSLMALKSSESDQYRLCMRHENYLVYHAKNHRISFLISRHSHFTPSGTPETWSMS